MLILALAVAFGLELVALVAFGLWGVRFGQNALTQTLFGVGTPLLIAVFWGTFLSPKAAVKLSPLLESGLKLVVFTLAAAALSATGYAALGAVFGALAAVITFGLYRYVQGREEPKGLTFGEFGKLTAQGKLEYLAGALEL